MAIIGIGVAPPNETRQKQANSISGKGLSAALYESSQASGGSPLIGTTVACVSGAGIASSVGASATRASASGPRSNEGNVGELDSRCRMTGTPSSDGSLFSFVALGAGGGGLMRPVCGNASDCG